MNTVNETGPHKGEFLFNVFETGQSGVQCHEIATGKTGTIWYSPQAGGTVSFDASFWTPWGTLITAEESWCSPAECTSNYGLLFELKNPLAAPGIPGPVSASSKDGAQMVHRNVIPRTSHEGIQFDSAGNMYFIDELNGGSALAAGLPGAVIMTDSNGVTSVDAPSTTDLPAFKGTDYQRPEDMQIQTVKGVSTTST